MAKRVSDEARILNFFSEADLGKAEVVYNLARDVMTKRLAPARAVKAAKKKAAKATKKTGPAQVNEPANKAAD